jgi:3-methylcrotonyl-CoA carboxylase alpha subunit
MLQRLLIANRGEIACRVIRTAKRFGLTTLAVFSEADAQALHVELADEAYAIGPAPARESYLAIDKIIEVARRAQAQAIHPGYGFLSENPLFAEACLDAGFIFVGPSPSAMRAMGSKAQAKALMERAHVPIVPGYHGDGMDRATLAAAVESIGFPALIKASGGGGGRGMRVVRSGDELAEAVAGAAREALASFGDSRLLVEKYLEPVRHIEIQIFADAQGECVAFPERDCSMQRRHQKILEETPAPGLSSELRRALQGAAVAAAHVVGYVGAGTIEFLVQGERFYFLEMNTRLQVEHPITEMISNEDLVAWQLRIAAGEPLPVKQSDIATRGCAIEVRVCAEDPAREFLPSIGTLAHFRAPRESAAIRVDAGVRRGDRVTPYYDSLLAKLIAWGEDRASALMRLRRALCAFEVVGVTSNLDFLRALVAEPRFERGEYDTGFAAKNAERLSSPAPFTEADETFLLAAGAARWLDEQRRTQRAEAAVHGDLWSPWASTDAWRFDATGCGKMEFEFSDRRIGAEVQPVASGFQLKTPSRSTRVEAQEFGDALRLRIDGASRELSVVRDAGRYIVVLNGRNHALTIVDPFVAPDERESLDRRLRAPLPARVSRVLARPGAKIKKGAPLVILEVMKTEFALAAPRDGEIESVDCREGDFVAEGAQLASLVEEVPHVASE